MVLANPPFESSTHTAAMGGFTATIDDPKMEWIFNTGAAAHLSPKRSGFRSYQQVLKGQILVANKDLCRIAEISSIDLAVGNEAFELQNVRHVPNLGYNLMSKGYLEYQGFKIDQMKDGFQSYYSIESPNSVIFKAHQVKDFIYRLRKPGFLVEDFTRIVAYAISAGSLLYVNDLIHTKAFAVTSLPLNATKGTELKQSMDPSSPDLDEFMITPIGKSTKVKRKWDTL
jgi:hypothetical protein